MPKLKRGRLDDVRGMSTFTANELFAWADELEREMNDPEFSDDPKWQMRRIKKIRKLAEQKEKSLEHKLQQ